MGINWYFKGDDNRNAAVSLAYRRKGTRQWRPALPLWRHEYGKTTMFSGSVFRLCPGTEYEFRLRLTDDDPIDGRTELEKVVAARTLDYPKMPSRVVAVPAGGLAAAQELAQPGTVMLLAPGTYPGVVLKKSGQPGRWIVYKAAKEGKVVINSRIEIRADYVWLHGLTIRDPRNAIQGSHKGICITRCRITSHYAIHTGRGGENYFIADNYLHGDANGHFTFSGEGVDFGAGRGACGHAVCFNELTDFADGISYGRGDIDVYNNYIHETVDDFIEPDYAYENYRLWNNLCFNSMCGFSFQPMHGGPWYIFNNVNVGAYLHALKVKHITGPSVIVANTFLTKSSQLGQGADILRGWIINNLWLRTTKGSLARGGGFRPGFSPVMVDYNAYGTGGAVPFNTPGYAELAKQYGWDRHSIQADYQKLFQGHIKVPPGKPGYWRGIVGYHITDQWHFNHNPLLPRAGTKIIDAGKVLPNITGPYLGKAPDLGAHELGLGMAWYGPRNWDERAGLIYGLPPGWRKLPIARASEYATLGCPPAGGARVLLARDKPRAFAHMSILPAAGEARWARAKASVANNADAMTKVLEFQDGLYVRLYRKAGNAHLVAARVEPAGVLHVTIGCRASDLPALRVEMFQLARSLYR